MEDTGYILPEESEEAWAEPLHLENKSGRLQGNNYFLEALRKEMPAARFQIVAINIDEKPKKALRFLDKKPVGYPSASDPEGKLPATFGLETMPTSYLIDQNGVIRLVHKGYHKGDIEKIKAEATRLIRKKR